MTLDEARTIAGEWRSLIDKTGLRRRAAFSMWFTQTPEPGARMSYT
jgi:hypothetical protein